MDPLGFFKSKDILLGFKAVTQGESHKEKNTPCQDAASFSLSGSKDIGIAVVADGHGGEKYFRSAKGSEFAVKIASQVIISYIGHRLRAYKSIVNNKRNNSLDMLKHIETKIIYEWRNIVLDDVHNNPFNEDELKFCAAKSININNKDELVSIYGTTLIAAFITDSYWFAIQIGDGSCVIIPGDLKARIAIPEDERLAFGKTTSLCNVDASENFRHIFGEEKILGITVATDGISDSFIPEKYLEFNINLMEDFFKSGDAIEKLENFLPELSRKGSRDDVSIAGLFNKTEGNKAVYREKQRQQFDGKNRNTGVLYGKNI